MGFFSEVPRKNWHKTLNMKNTTMTTFHSRFRSNQVIDSQGDVKRCWKRLRTNIIRIICSKRAMLWLWFSTVFYTGLCEYVWHILHISKLVERWQLKEIDPNPLHWSTQRTDVPHIGRKAKEWIPIWELTASIFRGT